MESKINTQAIECESIEELLTDAKSQEYIMGIENFSLKQIYFTLKKAIGCLGLKPYKIHLER